MGFTTDETEKRVLYQYLAEASVRFPQVFPVVYNLLETKVIEHLKYRYIHTQIMTAHLINRIVQNGTVHIQTVRNRDGTRQKSQDRVEFRILVKNPGLF